MKRTIYIYTCMECDFEWESTYPEERICPMCGCGDLHSEEVDDDDKN